MSRPRTRHDEAATRGLHTKTNKTLEIGIQTWLRHTDTSAEGIYVCFSSGFHSLHCTTTLLTTVHTVRQVMTWPALLMRPPAADVNGNLDVVSRLQDEALAHRCRYTYLGVPQDGYESNLGELPFFPQDHDMTVMDTTKPLVSHPQFLFCLSCSGTHSRMLAAIGS